MAFQEHIDMQIHRAGDGAATASIDARQPHLNPHGTVHGGVLAALADSAMAAALVQADDEQRPVTVSMTVTYLEAAPPGPIIARARVRRLGRRLTIAEADLVAGDDTVVATAVGTFANTNG